MQAGANRMTVVTLAILSITGVVGAFVGLYLGSVAVFWVLMAIAVASGWVLKQTS